MPVPVVSSSTNLNQPQQPQALHTSVPVPPYYVNQHIVFQPSIPVVPMNHWQQQPQALPVCTSTTICKSDLLHISTDAGHRYALAPCISLAGDASG